MGAGMKMGRAPTHKWRAPDKKWRDCIFDVSWTDQIGACAVRNVPCTAQIVAFMHVHSVVHA